MKSPKIGVTSIFNSVVSVVLLWALGITLYRGFQLPMKWATAHWLVGYDFGFTKRGLIGAALKPVISPVVNSPDAGTRIDILATAVLIGFCAVLFGETVRMMKRAGFSSQSILTAALFFTSPYFVMSGHLNGYFDNILVLLTILSIHLTRKQRFIPAAIVMTAGVLVHETILIVGLPSVLLAALLRLYRNGVQDTSSRPSLYRTAAKLTPFLLPLSVFAFIWVYQNYLTEGFIRRRALHDFFMKFDCLDKAHADGVSDAYTFPYIAYLRNQIPVAFKSFTARIHLVQILPNLLLMFLFIRRSISLRFPGRFFFAAALVNLCPFALFFIATDTSRLWTYPLITAMYTIWTLYQYSPAPAAAPPPAFRAVFYGALCLVTVTQNAFNRVNLMCGRRDLLLYEQRFLVYLPVLLVLCYCIGKEVRAKEI